MECPKTWKVFLYPSQMWMKKLFEYEYPDCEVIEIKLIPITPARMKVIHHAKDRKQGA